jgi:hypothetical protein
VFENRVLEEGGVTGDQRKLHNEKLHDLQYSTKFYSDDDINVCEMG